MQSPRVPEHVLRRQRREAQREAARPRPHFQDFMMPESPANLPWYPRPQETFENLPGSLLRSARSFVDLLDPFAFAGGVIESLPLGGQTTGLGFTTEQRAVGGFVQDAFRSVFPRYDYLREVQAARAAGLPVDVQSEYPTLVGAIEGYAALSPFGEQGTRPVARYIEEEGLGELAFEALPFVPLGVGRAVRALSPLDVDWFDRVDPWTGRRIPTQAEATRTIDVYGARQWRRFGMRERIQSIGTQIGSQNIAMASHSLIGDLAGGAIPIHRVNVRRLTGERVPIQGLADISPELDVALLQTAGVTEDYLTLASDLPLPGTQQIGIGFQGRVGENIYQDPSTGFAIGETSARATQGFSGASLVDPEGNVSGIYLGEIDDIGLYATGASVRDFEASRAGLLLQQLTDIDTQAAVDRLVARGLHYGLARGMPGIEVQRGLGISPFAGVLGLHASRYGVQEPFSLVRLDPARHREFDEGPVSGVFAYEGDLRDMLFEIKNPSLNWERRQSLLDYLRRETDISHIPDVFRQGGYDAITAVPSSVDRLRLRGFNQAEFYAEIFSDVLGIPFERDLLRRIRQTTESSKLEGRLSREDNLSGAFLADPSVAGRDIIAIDDIAATGSTMRENLLALRQAGAADVGGLAFASSLHSFQHPRAGLSRFSHRDVSTRMWGGVDFTTAQQRAISHIEGSAVISAVPGAGKTDVLVERVQQLMAGGISPSEVLTVAYNRAAIEELAARFEVGGLSSAQAQTIHSLAYEIVMDPENFTGVGFSHRPKIARDLTQDRFRQMMRQYPDAQVDFEQSEAFRMAAAAETDEEWLSAYQAFKRERGLLTFGQMLDVGAEILETRPDVRQRYFERYPFLQVDEFQDISQREWNFLSRLTPNVLGVGDINQAIYGFRGATGDVMADLYQTSAQYHLPETFRSTPEIFQTAQQLIGLNAPRIPIEGRSVLPSGAPVDFRATTGDTVFSELESILSSRDPSESTAVLVRTNREIRAVLDALGEEMFEGVDIGTIHKGKGQGWDRVILPMETVPVRFGDSPSTIWTPRTRTQADIEAARRVGYVGLTRARQHAHILGGGDLFEELRTGERHLQLHGLKDEPYTYGFAREVSDDPSLHDLNRFIQDYGFFARATHLLESSMEQTSLDWAQTLAVNMGLREKGVDIPLRGEASALFPRGIYEAHQREIDYQIAPGSFIKESPWEPGMMGVYQQGIYAVQDLELLLKHGYWNPNPRLHMGGSELRLFQGEVLKQGFQVSLPPDAQGYAPPGEFIINPTRMLGLFDYEDIRDLRTGEPFRSQPMELVHELGNYGLEGLRPIDELAARLNLHSRRGGSQETLQDLFRWADVDRNIFYRWVHPDEDSLTHSSISRPNVLYGMTNFADSTMYERWQGPRRGEPRHMVQGMFLQEGGRELRLFEGEDAGLDLLLSESMPEELFIPSRVLYAFDAQGISPTGLGTRYRQYVEDINLGTRVQALNRELTEPQWRTLWQHPRFRVGAHPYRSETDYLYQEYGFTERSDFLEAFEFDEFEELVTDLNRLQLHSRRFPPTASQQAALEHRYGSAVVIAGPGAGKSFTLTERLRYLTEQGITDPQQILSLVFGKEAQQDLLQRTRDIGDFDVRTLDAFAYGIVRENFGRLGYTAPPRITQDQFQFFLQRNLDDLSAEGITFRDDPDLRQKLQARYDEMRGNITGGREDYSSLPETVERAISKFRHYKWRRNELDFTDALNQAGLLLEEHPDLRQTYRERYPFVQIDEFQDVSRSQYRLLSHLSENLWAVGDLDQSIMSFRGGGGEVMRELLESGIQRYDIPENFRSTPEIVSAATAFIEGNLGRTPIELRSTRESGVPVEFTGIGLSTRTSEIADTLAAQLTQGQEAAILTRTQRERDRFRELLRPRLAESGWAADEISNVSFSTLHAAKGREWEEVFLPINLTEGRRAGERDVTFPTRHAITLDELAEEEHLFYVGMTRAKSRLGIFADPSHPYIQRLEQRQWRQVPSSDVPDMSSESIFKRLFSRVRGRGMGIGLVGAGAGTSLWWGSGEADANFQELGESAVTSYYIDPSYMPSSDDEAYLDRFSQSRRRHTFGEGLTSELEYLPERAFRHFSRHGTEGFGEILLDYPRQAMQRQGIRVAQNYAKDALFNLFRPEGQKLLMGFENYLGDTLGGGLKEALGKEVFGVSVGAAAGAASLAGLTAFIGERSLDAGYADVIESESEREQRFYDRFREQPTVRSSEIGGKVLESEGIEKFIERIVLRVLSEGKSDISDKLVTKIGRKVKVQMGRGQL